MPLTMRPTRLGAGIDKDRQDFTIYSGDGRSAGSMRRAVVPITLRQGAVCGSAHSLGLARHRLAVHWLSISGSGNRYNLLTNLYYSSLVRLTWM